MRADEKRIIARELHTQALERLKVLAKADAQSPRWLSQELQKVRAQLVRAHLLELRSLPVEDAPELPGIEPPPFGAARGASRSWDATKAQVELKHTTERLNAIRASLGMEPVQ